MTIILFIFWTALVLYILLETDVVPKWAEFLGLKFFKYDEWNTKREMFGDLKYSTFLATYYKNFFIQLLTCQECLCVWLNILGFMFFPAVIGNWWFFGITTVGSLIAIAALNFTLKKLYE